MNLYSEKEQSYYTSIRHELINIMPNKQGLKVLEIGAGGGDTLAELKKRKIADYVAGVELFRLLGTNQDNPLIDKMIIADIEKDDIDLPLNYFDVVLCADVLEHLYDPWNVVEKVSHYLATGGMLIVSVPNFSYLQVFKNLFIRKNFQYTERGTFDKTHIRFFCKNNIANLVTAPGLSQQKVIAKINLVPCNSRLINRLTLGIFESLLTPQYVGISIKTI